MVEANNFAWRKLNAYGILKFVIATQPRAPGGEKVRRGAPIPFGRGRGSALTWLQWRGRMSFFSKERIIAPPGFSRWLVPPAALSIHLAIGQAYAFSVFNLPMTKLIGITQSAPGDWKLTQLGWIFTLGIVFLGLSSAAAGRWLEDVGPRKAMFVAA